MSLVDKLKQVRPRPRPAPVWAGPCGEGPNGGVTFSLLSRYLCCPERFRIRTIEGLQPAERFNARIEYGNMWHMCEEEHAKSGDRRTVTEICGAALREYCQRLASRFPLDRDDIDKWYNVCKVQFPIYARYWAEHPDVTDRKPLLAEQTFDIPYQLPSGYIVRLRGKWDSVDLVGKGKSAAIWLQENKTKGDIDEEKIRRQLTFDLQTMLYLVSLETFKGVVRNRLLNHEFPLPPQDGRISQVLNTPVVGVRYNVVRRPLSGGKGTIVRHKPTKKNPSGESKEEYYARLSGIIAEAPETYFMRWNVEVTSADVARFRRTCLDPILENLQDDYEWWAWCWDNNRDPFDYQLRERDEFGFGFGGRHYRFPFGVSNPITEGYESDLDYYLATGNEVGLVRTENMFPELT